LGGVGSWAAEALARSGVSHLRLVDLDEICLSNVNRQLPALDGTIGRFKVEVIGERVQLINPDCTVEALPEFFTESTGERLLGLATTDGSNEIQPLLEKPDCVVDAIDSVSNKCRLLALCRQNNIPCISCGGAGGRRNPTLIRVVDLRDVTHDPLLREVRKRLRTSHGFPRGEHPLGIPCVYSTEQPVFPQPDGGVGCERPVDKAGPAGPKLNCDWGYGSATQVTGAFGFAAAAAALDLILGRLTPSP
jgi:tRNA A37 threonylcarbamoyladenosine dehydratase